jgi:serine/threonine protein kinase
MSTEEFKISERPHEVWPFIESGRFEKTFDFVSKLGEGAYGCVERVKHKLDSIDYAIKKIKIHMEFNDNDSREARKQALLHHPAMKEIEAIAKLSHKNIVGYKGCWVEAHDPDIDRINKI